MTESEGTPCNYRDIPTVEATPENIADYGVMFGERAHKAGLPIPFYKGSVEEAPIWTFSTADGRWCAWRASTTAPPRSSGWNAICT